MTPKIQNFNATELQKCPGRVGDPVTRPAHHLNCEKHTNLTISALCASNRCFFVARHCRSSLPTRVQQQQCEMKGRCDGRPGIRMKAHKTIVTNVGRNSPADGMVQIGETPAHRSLPRGMKSVSPYLILPFTQIRRNCGNKFFQLIP
jgi:hypothetical protein